MRSLNQNLHCFILGFNLNLTPYNRKCPKATFHLPKLHDSENYVANAT